MNDPKAAISTLIVGIGSHHGDDQAGWHVAERLIERAPSSVAVRKARSPSQLLDWLTGIERLILCDACRCGGQTGEVRRWEWPSSELMSTRWTGAHDVSLPEVLQLADRMGQLPASVVIWSIEAGEIGAGRSMSPEATAALPIVAAEIECELAGKLDIIHIRSQSCTNNR